jgi:hypothetical protein
MYDAKRMDEVLIPSSGKMVLLDKLLPKLKREGHKVRHSLFLFFSSSLLLFSFYPSLFLPFFASLPLLILFSLISSQFLFLLFLTSFQSFTSAFSIFTLSFFYPFSPFPFFLPHFSFLSPSVSFPL